MLKVQYITCEGTRAELHQIPASLWQMPEAGGRGSGGGGCGLDGEKIFEHLDQQAAAPHTSEPSGSEWHWRPPTAGKETGRLESVANSLKRSEQLVEGERKVSWTSAGGDRRGGEV